MSSSYSIPFHPPQDTSSLINTILSKNFTCATPLLSTINEDENAPHPTSLPNVTSSREEYYHALSNTTSADDERREEEESERREVSASRDDNNGGDIVEREDNIAKYYENEDN